MTKIQFKQLKKLISKIEDEALDEGIDITTPEFHSVILKLLKRKGFTWEEYVEAGKKPPKKPLEIEGVELMKGDKGDKGDSIKGDKGDKGDEGKQGKQGNSITGKTGKQGDKGDKGDIGNDADAVELVENLKWQVDSDIKSIQKQIQTPDERKEELDKLEKELKVYVDFASIPRGRVSDKGGRFPSWGTADKGSYGTAISDDRYYKRDEGVLVTTDSVNDTHIDWGTGTNQVSSADMPDHNSHTVRDTFVHIVNRGVAETITVTLTGGLGVSWSAGEIYDIANHTFVAVEAGSGNVTNNAVNYLKWVSGTTLTLATSDATGNEVLIAIGTVYDGVINGYREMSLLDESLANIRRCARAVFPTRVTSGMSVHEDTDATNPLDVTMDAGVYCKEIQERITPVEIKSRNTAMVRHFHTAGAWDSDTNAEIETTNYDNGTQKTAIPSNKWVKGLFIFMNGKIGFVYPTECFNTTAEAQDASLPAMPTGLEPVPKLTAIVYQQGAVNFTGAIWQDVRAGISEEAFAGVTDHGALAGLGDDDHTQYLLKAGGTMTGALEMADHGTAATDEAVNVCYGTGNPPAANTTTEGALFIKYTA